MGFWKNLRAVLAHPDIVNELEMERTARLQLSRALATAEDEWGKADTDAFLLEGKLGRTVTQLDSCQAALRALCSRPPSNEELKRIYEAAAPVQDRYGLGLYFAAKTLTKIEISTYFPYEESLGLFEDAKGPELMCYLTAARFGAVTWAAVPGTDCKKAVLGDVDTSAPEYREFERAIYARALEWAGLGDILTPEKDKQRPEHQKSEQKRGEAR